jgi:hypothetical protein
MNRINGLTPGAGFGALDPAYQPRPIDLTQPYSPRTGLPRDPTAVTLAYLYNAHWAFNYDADPLKLSFAEWSAMVTNPWVSVPVRASLARLGGDFAPVATQRALVTLAAATPDQADAVLARAGIRVDRGYPPAPLEDGTWVFRVEAGPAQLEAARKIPGVYVSPDDAIEWF